MNQSIKHRVYEILESSNRHNWLTRIDDVTVTILVILDVTDFILKTAPHIYQQSRLSYLMVDKIALVYFSFLYILQLWSCTADSQYAHPVKGRLKYATTPLVLIDLMAILPSFLRLLFPQYQIMRSLEGFRLLRLLKLIRYSDSFKTILRVLENKKQELLMTFFEVFILLIFASSFMYFAENKAQPDAFPSIPAAMWWGVVTLTTVGYGDIYPITAIGKFFGAFLALIGIGLFALPAGIIASGFSEEVDRKKLIDSASLMEKEMLEYINNSAEIMRLCVEAAKNKLGESIENEEIVKDLANSIYQEVMKKISL